ncbi:hypothetical protein [Nitrospina gracilis]|uniref:hypothetical protein n=1 Tax=Nitrospina gracilis TaxID=35801 RepID=UPI001F3338D3|nr:hypothetical protein [Nitrospina gracilis]MCF8721309.1 sterol desaturase/sphingolipid hydroxylase (fatty acid hydroxylase superfamily) [Nitrospina gracilis Nb-211]
MIDSIIIFVHLMSAAVGVGASVYCLYLILPRFDKQEAGQPMDENSITYKLLDVLVPTVFVSVLLLVGSGIYYLMENYTEQVNLKDGYYNILGIKLIFVIAAFFLSVYTTFALRPRISNLDLKPEEAKKEVRPTLDTMRTLSQVTLITIVFAVFMGIYLARF